MRTRRLSTWVVCLVCLNTMACLRSLDNSKIPCTTSDHCPRNYICVGGFCRVGKSDDGGIPSDATSRDDGPRTEKSDTRLLAEPDSATPPTTPDAPLGGTGGTGGAGGKSISGGFAGAGGSTSTGSMTNAGGSTGFTVVTSGGVAGTSGTSLPGGATATAGGATATSGGSVGTTDTTASGGKGGSLCETSGACPLKGAGLTCSAGTQCTSGFCVDGVCCDTRCDGQCESCKQTGYVGTCKAVKGDPVAPRTECTGTAPCKGQCDGVSGAACQYPGGSTSCMAAKCTAGKVTTATACDGKGTCTSPTIKDCASTLCSSDGLSCADSCAGLTCGTGTYCNGSTCVPKKDPGAACKDGVECKSTFCADNVCCNLACTERCRACNSSGVCTTVSGAVRHGTPCAADGTICGGTCDGTHDDCFYPLNVSCGTTSSCNEQMTMLNGSACNGAGTCAANPKNCATLNQYCDSTTTSCVARLTAAGAPCILPIQCNSGNCDASHCCPANQKWCGGACIDTSTSKTNCGSCGNACSSLQSCVGGVCSCNGSMFCTGGTDQCGKWDFSSGVQGWEVMDPDPSNRYLSVTSGRLVLHVNSYDPTSDAYPQLQAFICPPANSVAATNGYTLSANIRFEYNMTTGLSPANYVRLIGNDGRPIVAAEQNDPAGYTWYPMSGMLTRDSSIVGLIFGINQYFSGTILIDDITLTPP
jgi:hypothetical protein